MTVLQQLRSALRAAERERSAAHNINVMFWENVVRDVKRALANFDDAPSTSTARRSGRDRPSGARARTGSTRPASDVLIIRGQPYRVTAVAGSVRPLAGGTRYDLTSRRGASYFTIVNGKQPHLLFVIPRRAGSKTMNGVLLSDVTGELRVVRQ